MDPSRRSATIRCDRIRFPRSFTRLFLPTVPLICVLISVGICCGQTPADRVYRNGIIFTANEHNDSVEALAVRDGRIVYVGSNQGAADFVGATTKVIDLKGKFLMPGLIDGHMHPLEAGAKLLKCSLNYESLTIAEMQQRIQSCLDHEASREPDAWLEVVSWFQESMRPAGVKTSRATLDALKTKRPILVVSSFGHTALANTRALALAKITAKTPDPVGGKIWHDANGEPTGLLEDSAYEVFDGLLPKATAEENLTAATAALKAMNRQGVTSFLDAAAPAESIAAFSAVRQSGGLTARAHFAPVISPAEASDIPGAIARVVALAKQYDQGTITASPSITVRNAKLFLDGVIAAPALTGAVLEPYRVNAGTAAQSAMGAGVESRARSLLSAGSPGNGTGWAWPRRNRSSHACRRRRSCPRGTRRNRGTEKSGTDGRSAPSNRA